MDLRPVTLQGRFVKLEPLQFKHAVELWPAADERDLWAYMPTHVREPKDLEAWVAARLADQATGTTLPFVQREARTGQAIGSTSILDARPLHRGVEIGHTWLGASHRRTAANTESKLLLLAHCFETLGCLRVQLKTDARNVRSQRAIERLGAQREGVLRRHIVMPDGYVRDSVMYSITDLEWPQVRERLRGRLADPDAARPRP